MIKPMVLIPVSMQNLPASNEGHVAIHERLVRVVGDEFGRLRRSRRIEHGNCRVTHKQSPLLAGTTAAGSLGADIFFR
jgi:hypothetical protein